MKIKHSILALIILTAMTPPVRAAVVYLNDGSQVKGTVVSATARDVKLHTPSGDLNIDAEKILRIDYADDAPAGRPLEEKPIERAQPRYGGDRLDSESGQEKQLISVVFGLGTPLSRVDFKSAGGGSADNGDAGFLLGTQYSYFVSPRLGLGASLEFINRSRNSTQSLLPAANTDVYGNTMLMLATARYSLTAGGRARPYLMAGIGTNRTSTVAEATPNAAFAWSDTSTTETRTLVDDSRWGLASSLRFGIDFHWATPTIFSLEFGWIGLSNSDASATAAGRDVGLEEVDGDLNILTVGARWGWRF